MVSPLVQQMYVAVCSRAVTDCGLFRFMCTIICIVRPSSVTVDAKHRFTLSRAKVVCWRGKRERTDDRLGLDEDRYITLGVLHDEFWGGVTALDGGRWEVADNRCIQRECLYEISRKACLGRTRPCRQSRMDARYTMSNSCAAIVVSQAHPGTRRLGGILVALYDICANSGSETQALSRDLFASVWGTAVQGSAGE